MPPIRSILVPIDFSEASRSALSLAVDFGRTFGAPVTLLHVYGVPARILPPGYVARPEEMQEIADRATRALETLRRQSSGPDVEVRAIATLGIPENEILERARDFDLVVMGTHGRTGMSHFLLGSVTARVLARSPCPVLTVRAEEHRSIALEDARSTLGRLR